MRAQNHKRQTVFLLIAVPIAIALLLLAVFSSCEPTNNPHAQDNWQTVDSTTQAKYDSLETRIDKQDSLIERLIVQHRILLSIDSVNFQFNFNAHKHTNMRIDELTSYKNLTLPPDSLNSGHIKFKGSDGVDYKLQLIRE